MRIWERRNLAYFDRRQRKLAEERQRQQQQQEEADMSGEESVTTHSTEVDEQELSAPLSSLPRDQQQQEQQQQQQHSRQARFICAADDPKWREMTSRNIMGDYDPQRASRDPAYRHAWVSCQRLVNMNTSGVDPNDFVPTNPRLAALLEHMKHEIARERHEEETALSQQRQQQEQGHFAFRQGRLAGEQDTDAEGEAVTPRAPGNMLAAQATEDSVLNQVHRLQPTSQSSSNSRKRSASGSSREMHVTKGPDSTYYLALPYATSQFFKSVVCSCCNCALYTTPVAMRFFCQVCGRVSSIPRCNDESRYEEKMQDAEDQHVSMS